MRQDLTFASVDELAYAAELQQFDAQMPAKVFAPRTLGPFVELLMLSESGLLPQITQNAWIDPDTRNPLMHFLHASHTQFANGSLGFMRVGNEPAADLIEWTKFGLQAQRAAEAVGFAHASAAQFVGAIKEMHSNIYDHSQASGTGLVGFQATTDGFEFLVADRGIGVLQSLRANPDYAHITRHGDALAMALRDGCTRYHGEPTHGRGFNPIFTGLANLNGALRFRSGDAAVVINGRNPGEIRPKIARKPPFQGFLASIRCLKS